MKDLNEYSNSPVFEGLKTTNVCCYQSEFELRLMQQFEATAKVMSYHQPVILALVKNTGIRRYINISFWVEYQNKEVDLVYIEKPAFVVGDQAHIFILGENKELPVSFGFVVVNERSGNFRRIRNEKLKLNDDVPNRVFCLFSFRWIN